LTNDVTVGQITVDAGLTFLFLSHDTARLSSSSLLLLLLLLVQLFRQAALLQIDLFHVSLANSESFIEVFVVDNCIAIVRIEDVDDP